MKSPQALAGYRREIRELVAQNRARNPRIFGSVLHGRDTETSDLDRAAADDIFAILQLFDRDQRKTAIPVAHDGRAADGATHRLQLDEGQLRSSK